MSYDVRTIANFVLDRAEHLGVPMTNVHINKVVYFLYCWFLLEKSRKLTSAKIEAWQFGPVFRELYQEFKRYGDGAIRSRARRLNLATGELEVCQEEIIDGDREFLASVAETYIRARPFDLVNLTHKKDTPWYKVYNHGGRSNPKMEISDDLILEYFRMHPHQ